MSHWLQRLLVTGSVLLLVACKPDEGAEKSQWGANQAAVSRIGSHYPQAKQVLSARLNEAKGKWDLALKESDTEKRAQQLSDVNDYVRDLTGGIEAMESRIDTIERLKRDSRFRKLAAGLVMPAFSRADRAVSYARSRIRTGPILTAEDLKARTHDANSELITAVNNLERLAKTK